MLDASALLCENCGYVLDGLLDRTGSKPDAKCPECGKPIAESLPERRVGSAWQRDPRFASWLGTNYATIRWPVRRWRVVLPERSRSFTLFCLNCCSAGVLLAGSLAFQGQPRQSIYADTGGVFGFVAAVFLLLLVLSGVESLGIQAFGARRRWRVNRNVAWSIVGHASIGWMLGALAAGVVPTLARALAWKGWGYNPGHRHGGDSYEVLAFAASIAVGLVCFETLTYLGFRQMRFANQARGRTTFPD